MRTPTRAEVSRVSAANHGPVSLSSRHAFYKKLSEVKSCTVMVITSYLENRASLSNLDNPFSKLLLINAECQYLSKSMTAIEWWAILFYILPSNCLLIPVQATAARAKHIFV